MRLLRPLFEFTSQVTAIVKPVTSVQVHDLQERIIVIDAPHRLRMIASDVRLTEQGQSLGEEVVEIRRDDKIRNLVAEQQVSEPEVCMRDRLLPH